MWNLALNSQNNILAALAQVTNDNEMLIYFVDKNSGAQMLSPHKIWHDQNAAPTLQMIRPFQNQNLFWASENVLYISSGFYAGFDCRYYSSKSE